MKIKFKSKALLSLLTAMSIAPSFIPGNIHAQELTSDYSELVVISDGQTIESLIEPVMGPHGYFVDVFQSNRTENQSPQNNAVIGVLNEFLELFQLGVDSEAGAEDRWRLGTVLNEASSQNSRPFLTLHDKKTNYLTWRRTPKLDSLFYFQNTITIVF